MARWARDTAWAVVGVGGAFAGMKAIELLRPPVIADDAGAPENNVGMRELPRAYFFSAGAIVVGPSLGGPALPRVCGPLGLVLEVASVGLRVWAMRTLQGHYAHTLRVVDDQPVVRDGPYRFVRHPGYLSVVLLWVGAALSSRTVDRAGVDADRGRDGLPAPDGRRGRAPAAGAPGLRGVRRDDGPPGAAAPVRGALTPRCGGGRAHTCQAGTRAPAEPCPMDMVPPGSIRRAAS